MTLRVWGVSFWVRIETSALDLLSETNEWKNADFVVPQLSGRLFPLLNPNVVFAVAHLIEDLDPVALPVTDVD
jgi:hypothetical protein